MKPSKMPDYIEISRFELTHIIGIDLGYFVASNGNEFNAQRGIAGWLDKLRMRFDKSESYGFKKPRFDESEYSKTERVGRNTFSSYYAFNLMPLSFELVDPVLINEKYFKYKLKSVRIGPKGSLSLRVDTILNTCVSADTLIDQYFRYRTSLKNRLHKYINNFIKCWNGHVEEFLLRDSTQNEIEEHAHYYEIIDFDYHIAPGNRFMTISEIFSSTNIDLLKQLAGLSRMSPSHRHYASTALSNFKYANISNRDDELWVINEERLLRYHPESKKNIYIDSFFEDVKLCFEILLQQEVNLEYLSAWINKKKSELRIMLSEHYSSNKSVGDIEIQTVWAEIANMSDIFCDQFIIQRNVKHSFYNSVLRKAFEVLSIESIIKQTKDSFNDLFANYSIYSSQKSANLSLDLEEANLKLNKSVKLLNVCIVIMTLIMLGVGLLQTYIAVKGINKGGLTSSVITNKSDQSKVIGKK